MIPIRDFNPTTRRPYVTVAIIVTCILVFFWQASLGPSAGQQATMRFGFIPALFFGHAAWPAGLDTIPSWATLFTSMFMHGGFMHLAGNMLYLWIFGNNIEDATGHVRYALFYLLCGLAAAMAQAIPDPHSTIPMIGASGAISGVLGAYLLLFPKAKVMVIIPIGFLFVQTLPAGWLLGFWIVFQLGSGFASASNAGGGVAWWAHVGGFVAGMALIHLFRDKIRQISPTAISAGVAKRRPKAGRSRIPNSKKDPQDRPKPTVERRRDP